MVIVDNDTVDVSNINRQVYLFRCCLLLRMLRMRLSSDFQRGELVAHAIVLEAYNDLHCYFQTFCTTLHPWFLLPAQLVSVLQKCVLFCK